MASLGDLNLKDVKADDFDVLPAGDYPAIIISSERKPTKDGTGERLNIKLQILDGKFQNRTLFDGFNIKNQSEKSQQIGRSQLKSVCNAVNVPEPKAAEELHMKPLMISVIVGKDQNGNPRNEVKKYKPRLTTAKKAEPQSGEKSLVEQAFEDTPVKKNPFA